LQKSEDLTPNGWHRFFVLPYWCTAVHCVQNRAVSVASWAESIHWSPIRLMAPGSSSFILFFLLLLLLLLYQHYNTIQHVVGNSLYLLWRWICPLCVDEGSAIWTRIQKGAESREALYTNSTYK
jgi:hypothetical protein